MILLPLACTTCLALLGCKDSRRRQPTDALAVTTSAPALPADASPQDVVTFFLNSAREVQHIRAAGFAKSETQDAYVQGMAALRTAINSPALFQRVINSRTVRLPAGLTEDAAATTATESWLSILAHYIDGIQMESIRQSLSGDPHAKVATVAVQAENPDEVEALAKLEASPEIADAKDAKGNPITSGTPAYQQLIRKRALDLDPPVIVPVRVYFSFTLERSSPDAPWGIVHLRINAPLRTVVNVNVPTPAATAETAEARQ